MKPKRKVGEAWDVENGPSGPEDRCNTYTLGTSKAIEAKESEALPSKQQKEGPPRNVLLPAKVSNVGFQREMRVAF